MINMFSFSALLRCFGSGSSCKDECQAKQWKLASESGSPASSFTSSSASWKDCPSLPGATDGSSSIEEPNSPDCVYVHVTHGGSFNNSSESAATTSSDADDMAAALPPHCGMMSHSGAFPAAPAVAPLPAALAHPQLPAALLLRLAAMEKRFGQQLGTFIIYEEEDGEAEGRAAEGDGSHGSAAAAASGAGHASDCAALLAASLAAFRAAAGTEEGGVPEEA